jgi:ligand-binding sensor domain-containing protein/AraC-like DNA-binding protein
MNKIILLFFLVCKTILQVQAHQDLTPHQLGSQDGLTNSAIMNLAYGADGYLWIGTCDGIHRYNSQNISRSLDLAKGNYIKGNIIEGIQVMNNQFTCIQTNYSFDVYHTHKGLVKHYPHLKGKNPMATSAKNEVFVLSPDNQIHYICLDKDSLFTSFALSDFTIKEVKLLYHSHDVIHFLLKNGLIFKYKLNANKTAFVLLGKVNLQEEIVYAQRVENSIYIQTKQRALIHYEINENIPRSLLSIAKLFPSIQENISSLCFLNKQLYIGFSTAGLFSVTPKEGKVKRLLQVGVFCLLVDKTQNILWAGTDGQGLYAFYKEPYQINFHTINTSQKRIRSSVRCIHEDHLKQLWIGTKGDGIFVFNHYRKKKWNSQQQFTAQNSTLQDNRIYCFQNSQKNILWIGTEDGIYYYDYHRNQIVALNTLQKNKKISYIHAIYEHSPNTLWVASVGQGIIKLTIDWSRSIATITNTEQIYVDNGTMNSNFFFTAHAANDSILWFGNRGKGAFKININTKRIEPYKTGKINDEMKNDVFAITSIRDTLYFGTGNGLIEMQPQKINYFDESTGFINSTIHHIINTEAKNLWISTNRGIIQFNPKQSSFRTYLPKEMLEFCDGAGFASKDGTLYFGGINGVISIRKNASHFSQLMPSLQFDNLTIRGEKKQFKQYLHQEEKPILTLKANDNFFSFDCIVLNYRGANHYAFSHQLEGISEEWSNFSSNNTLNFTNIPSGKYNLKIKAKDLTTNKIIANDTLPIIISFPWYKTNWAYILWFILSLLLITSVIYFTHNWLKLRRLNYETQLKALHKEKVYQSKLSVFSTMAQWVVTPLQLIESPCDKLLKAENDSYLSNHISIIKHNAQKLRIVISEIMEFSRMDTMSPKHRIISCNIENIINSVVVDFSDYFKDRNINYIQHISTPQWQTNTLLFDRLISNLFSFIINHCEVKEELIVVINQDEKNLLIKYIYKGLPIDGKLLNKKADIALTLEENTINLSICLSILRFLKGNIEILNYKTSKNAFLITLPLLPLSNARHEDEIETLKEHPITYRKKKMITTPKWNNQNSLDEEKSTIIIHESNEELLWLIADGLNQKYNLISLTKENLEVEKIKHYMPQLLIIDIDTDDQQLLEKLIALRKDLLIHKIPIILLGTESDNEQRLNFINIGINTFIAKPFNVTFLERFIENRITQEVEKEAYYRSPKSPYLLNTGQIIHQEDQAYLEQVYQVINHHIKGTHFNVEILAQEMGVSSRQFYRKIKSITHLSPAQIIKTTRIELVKQLLVSTKLSISEIMYESGFNNKASFYKIFTHYVGETPKKYRERIWQQKQEELKS